jgi:hypothetical protein
VAQQAPEAARPVVQQAVSDAFMNGFGNATLVAAGMAFFGMVCALRFLPARPKDSGI